MEACGIVLAFPVTFVASLGYTLFALFVLSRWSLLVRVIVAASLAVLMLAATELLLLGTNGILATRATLGSHFEVMHAVVFFLTPPAVANVIVFFPRSRPRRVLVGSVATVITFVTAITLVFWNIHVSETLYGPDGAGGPYSRTSVQHWSEQSTSGRRPALRCSGLRPARMYPYFTFLDAGRNR